jgi:regulator of replication initiation timing
MSNIRKEIGSALIKFATNLMGEQAVKLAESQLKDGTIITTTQEEWIVGGDVAIMADGVSMPLPAGSYELIDGTVVVVEVDGVIASITPMAAEAPAEPAAEVEVKIEPEAMGAIAQLKELVAKLGVQVASLQGEVTELRKQSKEDANLSVELSKLRETFETLNAKPATDNEAVKLAKVKANKANDEALASILPETTKRRLGLK